MKQEKLKRPLSVLLVGCGRASKDHVRAIAYFEKRGLLSLDGLVDRDERAIQKLIETRGRRSTPLVSDNLDKILSQKSFDLTVIATPPKTHANIGMKAIRSGSHLVVEKPLTLDLEEAKSLLQAGEEEKKAIAIGFKYRYIPGVLELKNLIQSGTLGNIVYGTVVTRWGHDQAYYDQAGWFGTWEAEGGALLNQSVHALDLMAWLMEAKPVGATAVLARQCHAMEAADFVSGILHLEGNRYLLLEGTTNTDPDHHEASFFLRCEKGTVRASFSSGKKQLEIVTDDGRKLGGKLMWGAVKARVRCEGISVLRQIGNPYTFLYRDMIDVILKGGEPIAPGEAGLDSLLQAFLILQAGKEQRTVPYPPEGFHLSGMKGFFD